MEIVWGLYLMFIQPDGKMVPFATDAPMAVSADYDTCMANADPFLHSLSRKAPTTTIVGVCVPLQNGMLDTNA